jgi:hypothetical protein
MIVAVVALIVAMGGTSYAAITLPRNSVGPRQIRAGAVGSSELRDRSLGVRDLSRRARAALRGPQGPPGPAGPPGSAAAGGAGGSGTVTVKTAAGSVGAAPVDQEVLATATATCDPGQRVVSGGASTGDPAIASIHASFPAATGSAWTVTVGNDTTTARAFTVFAVCIT